MIQYCDYQKPEHLPNDNWELKSMSPREYAGSAIWKHEGLDDVEFTKDTSWLKGPRQRNESIVHDRWQINRSFQQRISDLVRKSELLQDLNDEDGHPIVTRASLDRSHGFLKDLFDQALEEYGIEIDIPDILPGPNQSVDILWHFPSYELLVNIPANAEAPPAYYGDDRGENSIKGSMSTPDSVRMVRLWLCLKQ